MAQLAAQLVVALDEVPAEKLGSSAFVQGLIRALAARPDVLGKIRNDSTTTSEKASDATPHGGRTRGL